LHIIGAAVAAALGIAGTTPAAAAPVSATNNATGKALILVPLTLTKIDDISFGTVIPSGTSGTVIIDAFTGARSFTGGTAGVASDLGLRARFAGAGSPNQQVIVVVNSPLLLTNAAGDTMTVVTLTQDGSPIRTIDPVTRAFFVHVGGVINVNANQPEGDYKANFTVTANYL
jgi:hypothetical protein